MTADNNRRQGLSITDGKKIKILNSTLKNTHGQMPKSGINIEPNPNQSVEDVDISNNNILNNHGFGIVVAGDHFTTTAVRNIRIYDNLILDNSDGIWVGGLE